MPKVAKNHQKLISFKDGLQTAEINGQQYQFDFSEIELAKNIEANSLSQDLSHSSGLNSDDYTPTEMAVEIAYYWETEDVERLIADIPADRLQDYRKELEHAA